MRQCERALFNVKSVQKRLILHLLHGFYFLKILHLTDCSKSVHLSVLSVYNINLVMQKHATSMPVCTGSKHQKVSSMTLLFMQFSQFLLCVCVCTYICFIFIERLKAYNLLMGCPHCIVRCSRDLLMLPSYWIMLEALKVLSEHIQSGVLLVTLLEMYSFLHFISLICIFKIYIEQ